MSIGAGPVAPRGYPILRTTGAVDGGEYQFNLTSPNITTTTRSYHTTFVIKIGHKGTNYYLWEVCDQTNHQLFVLLTEFP